VLAGVLGDSERGFDYRAAFGLEDMPSSKISRTVALRVMQKTGGKCYYCGVELLDLSIKATVDHLVPVFRGGGHEMENLVPCCSSCNSRKGTSTIEEFRIRYPYREAGCEPFTAKQLVYLKSLGLDMNTIVPAAPVFYGETCLDETKKPSG
jgi:hypothetical protein